MTTRPASRPRPRPAVAPAVPRAVLAGAGVSALVLVLALLATAVDPSRPWVPAALAGSRGALPQWWGAVLAVVVARACLAAARDAGAGRSSAASAPRRSWGPVPLAWAVLGAALVVVSVQHVVPLPALVSGSPWLGVLPWPIAVHPVEAAVAVAAVPAAVVLVLLAPGRARWWLLPAGACLALAWGALGTGLLRPSWDLPRTAAVQLAVEQLGVLCVLVAALRSRGRSWERSGGRSGGSGPEVEPARGAALLEVVALVDVLRSPGGCAWTAAQTHASLTRYAVEEAHEVVVAVEAGDPAALREELGDLLLQVVLHARLAQERPGDGFDVDDVARGLAAKLRRRHPHVFGPDAHPATVEELEADWHRLKAAEGGRRSVLDGVPASLPALQRAQQVLERAARAGGAGTGAALPGPARLAAEQDLGELLLGVVEAARHRGEDAEAALRGAVRHLEERVRATGA